MALSFRGSDRFRVDIEAIRQQHPIAELVAGYGVGMSHFVCAAADVAIAANNAAASIFGVLMGLPPR